MDGRITKRLMVTDGSSGMLEHGRLDRLWQLTSGKQLVQVFKQSFSI